MSLDLTPRPFHQVFELSCIQNPNNTAIHRLERDYRALEEIRHYICHELGQPNLICLSDSHLRSKSALAMYAGDGIVVKILPTDFSDRLGNVPYLLPSINRKRFEGINSEFVVKTYPWLRPSHVSSTGIDTMRNKIAQYGLTFIEGDDRADNIHKLPDRESTLTGIDSDMFFLMDGMTVDQAAVKTWIDYVHGLFPIYRSGEIPRQSEKTNFSFVSIHQEQMTQANEPVKGPKPPSLLGNLLYWASHLGQGKEK